MGKKRIRSVLFLAVLCFSAVPSVLISEFGEAKVEASLGVKIMKKNELIRPAAEEKLLIVLLEFNDLLCCLCTDSLLSLLRVLPLPVQRERTWMVVVLDSQKFSENQKKIIITKVRGFIKGNGLHTPYCIDFSHSFDPVNMGGSLILVMDSVSRSVDKHPLPLDSELRSQVVERLLY